MKEINTSLEAPAFSLLLGQLAVNSVSDLTFIEITDTLRPDQWADWSVEFSYQGKEYEGSLQAGVHNAEDFHHDVIEYVKENIK